jgi:very-short-patch-repair endonuclease
VSVAGGPTDERIDAIAATQRTVVGRAQLAAAGIAPRAIDRRLQNGRLRLRHRGVYLAGPQVEVELAEETAAVLAAGDGAVLSHHSAATLWQLRPGTARPVHVTIRYGRQGPRLDGVIVHRSRILTPADVMIHRGLPVTTPARTVLDVAARLDDRGTELVAAEAFAGHRCDANDLRRQLARSGAHPGCARLARVLGKDGSLALTDSDEEEIMYGLIVDAGLPVPQTRAWMLDYLLDFHWPDLRLGCEVDAYGTHGSPAKFESDRRRDARLLTEAGITIVRVTRLQIRQAPLVAVATVAQAVALAAERRREAQLLRLSA